MLTVDWTIFLQVANFLLLIGVLHLILFRPLGKVIQSRRDEMKGNLQQAENLEVSLNEQLTAYEQQLDRAKSEIAAERKEFRQNLAAEEAVLLKTANEAAATELQTIKDRVCAEKNQALADLKKQASTLAAQVAQKVVGRTL